MIPLKIKTAILGAVALLSKVPVDRGKGKTKVGGITVRDDDLLDNLRKVVPKQKVIQKPPTQLLIARPDPSLPAYYRPHNDDCGLDVYALEDIKLYPFQTKKVPLNIQMALNRGYFIRVTGRSGLSSQGLLIHPGTVDAGYRGIIKAIATNLTFRVKHIRRGDRVAQLIVQPYAILPINEVKELPSGDRGDEGFGQSGT